MKKVIALLLCAVMCLPFFAACGPDAPVDTTALPTGTTNSALQTTNPVTTTDGNDEVTEPVTTGPDYGFKDVAKNDYSEYQFRMLYSAPFVTDFLCEEDLNGDILNDQVYKRNKEMEDTYNIDIWVDDFTNYNYRSTLTSQISAGWTEGDYNLYATPGRCGITDCLSGLTADLGSYDEINLYRNYWDQGYLNELMIEDSVYAIVGEFSVFDQIGIEILLFNKNILRQEGLNEPYDLVRAKEWNIDALLGYMGEYGEDLNGNGFDEEDLFSITGLGTTSASSIFYSSGFKLCQNTGDTILLDFDRTEADNAVEALLDVWCQKNAFLYDSKITPGIDKAVVYDLFANGQALFTSMALRNISVYLSEMEDDYGIIPMPMHSEEQKEYFSYVGNEGIPLIIVPSVDPNPARTGNIIEAFCALSHDVVIPKVFEIVTKIQNVRDEDSAEMIEIARASKIFDPAHWLGLHALTWIAIDIARERQNVLGSFLRMHLDTGERQLNNYPKSYSALKK